MSMIEVLLRRSDGVVRTGELLRAGVTPRQIAGAVRRGEMVRARQGCFVRAGSSEDVERAVRVGGRLTSFSALAAYGVAVPESVDLHVHIRANGARLREHDDRFSRLDRQAATCHVHHHRLVDDGSSTPARVSLIDAILHASKHARSWDVVAAIDSARHRGVLDTIDVERLRQSLPAATRWLVDVSTDQVGEYIESVARIKLLLAGVPSIPQVNVLDERWIDLVVGDRIAIECDGKGKYERGATVHADRQRDAFLEAVGYHVIRLSYAMIIHDWDATLSMILAVIERRDHLSRGRA